MVKDAVETVFKVKVLKVNVINAPAKRGRKSRSRRLLVRNSGYKKAIVTLSPEDRIQFFEGVE
jgi:large subunit ribosomal protein L23